ncbi:MAG: type II toxin-antitoxin system Phd/YefM family antitoxin [Erysipelotrichaceae bacterium]|nr:type II toxin-antitoxin system Phd/YefM family antitoxin [Erysipelotrichaceae bacterium]
MTRNLFINFVRSGMLEVDIDKILPVTEARDNFNKIIDEVGGTDHMYVLTKNGKPSAVVVGVNHLEKLTGKSADELTSMVEKKADQAPVVEEISSPDGGSKPPVTVPTDSPDVISTGSRSEHRDVGVTEPMATGQSIQPGPSPVTPPPLDVPPETSVSSPMDIGAAPPASGASPPPAPPQSEVEEVASNQAPAPPNQSANGGAAASDSDLFV